MPSLARQEAALEPVRAALLRKAERRAADAVARATELAAALAEQARSDAEAAVASAAVQGAEQARPAAGAELSRGRQIARSIMLGADRAVREDVAGAISDTVLALREAPDYPLLRDRLGALAAAAAGPGAVVTEHPEGGVIARAGGLVVDCSLPRLGERAITALGERITALCGPRRPAGGPDVPREEGRQ